MRFMTSAFLHERRLVQPRAPHLKIVNERDGLEPRAPLFGFPNQETPVIFTDICASFLSPLAMRAGWSVCVRSSLLLWITLLSYPMASRGLNLHSGWLVSALGAGDYRDHLGHMSEIDLGFVAIVSQRESKALSSLTHVI